MDLDAAAGREAKVAAVRDALVEARVVAPAGSGAGGWGRVLGEGEPREGEGEEGGELHLHLRQPSKDK